MQHEQVVNSISKTGMTLQLQMHVHAESTCLQFSKIEQMSTNCSSVVQVGAEPHLVNADSVLIVHLVKLINKAHSLVCKDQSSTLKSPFPGDGILLN